MPEWFVMDEEAMTVEIEIAAMMDGGWKFNGIANGDATITVPQGFSVRVNFMNNDGAMVHSMGISQLVDPIPAMFSDPTPVFEGAISDNPVDMTSATQPGAGEILDFVADAAGEYALFCYIPGHAVSGMWMRFNVSADGEAGVQM